MTSPGRALSRRADRRRWLRLAASQVSSLGLSLGLFLRLMPGVWQGQSVNHNHLAGTGQDKG